MYSEDEDPSQVTSKKLASLFEKSSSDGGNSSLMYKAPKQPKSSGSVSTLSHSVRHAPPSKDTTLGLILLKVVQAFKLENNNYVGQGKLGAAILGNVTTRQYQLILYKEKTSHITHAQINPQFWFAVQSKNYASFRDKNNVLWSLLFENSPSLMKFSTEIALARWGCSGSIDHILTQDLCCADSACAEDDVKVGEDSRVQVTYTATLISAGNKLNKQLEIKENVVINISKSNDSWNSSLLGSVKGSRKIIILPPNFQGKWKSSVQQNEGIALEVQVLAVDSPVLLEPEASIEKSNSPESSVKVKGASISEVLSSSSQSPNKSSLISRMARMGQATLPFKGARVPDISDSDETEDNNPLSRPLDRLEHTTEPRATSIGDESLDIAQSLSPAPLLVNNQITTRTPMAANFTSIATSPLDSQFSVFFSELRTNNSELRMGMNRVADKLDKVSDKMEVNSFDSVIKRLKSMEANMISQFNDVQMKNKELFNSIKQETLKESVGLARDDSNEHELLRRENKELEEALAQCLLRAKELKEKLEDLSNLKSGLNLKLVKEQRTREIIDQENSSVITQLQNNLREQQETISFWTEAMGRISQRVPELEKKIEERQKMNNENRKTIKKLMTTVYRKLQSRFPNGGTLYTSSEIHTALRDIIKGTTLEYFNTERKRKQVTAYSNRTDDMLVSSAGGDDRLANSVVAATVAIEPSSAVEIIESKSKLECGSSDSTRASDAVEQLSKETASYTAASNTINYSEPPQFAEDKLEDVDNSMNDNVSKSNEPIQSSEQTVNSSSAQEWSPKQPPPLFDDDDTESDDSWLK